MQSPPGLGTVTSRGPTLIHFDHLTLIPIDSLTVPHTMSQDPVQLLSQADKAYSNAGSGFSFFGSRTEKYENAAELYIKAASAYRAKRAMWEAGMAYEKVLLT